MRSSRLLCLSRIQEYRLKQWEAFYELGKTSAQLSTRYSPEVERSSLIGDHNSHRGTMATVNLAPNHSINQKKSFDNSTLWHSTAHLLGYALETLHGDNVWLLDGPATQTGFYYDSLLIKNGAQIALQLINENTEKLSTTESILRQLRHLYTHQDVYHIKEAQLPEILSQMKSFAEKNLGFECISITREQAFKMFAYNPFKLSVISKIDEKTPILAYKCGDFIDLCRGPHVANSKVIQDIDLLKTGSVSLNAHEKQQNISRISGISFQSKKEAREWRLQIEEAKKRDHRTIGKQQELFMMHPLSPGCVFLLPNGMKLKNRLIDMLRNQYASFGYQEVESPLIFNRDLWKTSGHWENYKNEMFVIENSSPESTEEEVFGIKPMNCPAHCLMYASQARSYRSLPLRYAEFGSLHRNEASGALTGLTRVRRFHQDDAHIFCTPDQIQDEILQTLSMIDRIYTIFGFEYDLALSTRPESFIGDEETWRNAESMLQSALDQFSNQKGRSWTLNAGDGAFYGPKIDLLVKDAMKRRHQLGTVQLDFNLPNRFNLKYQSESGSFCTPVMIHRAILGSIERVLAVLIEHFAGKWPLWLSPRQIRIVPVSPEFLPYAQTIKQDLSRFHVEVDDSDHQFSKKIRNATIDAVNYTLIVGEKERRDNVLSVRERGGRQFTTTLREFQAILDEKTKNIE